MASTTVFVDDAVRGTRPRVCAGTGQPTADRLRITTTVGGSTHAGVVWLLLVLAVVVTITATALVLYTADAFGLGARTWPLGAAVAALGGTVALVAQVRLARGGVGVDLAASRRWVTLRGVHPDFAAACVREAHRAGHRA